MLGEIIICNDFDLIKNEFLSNYSKHNLKIFYENEFLIEMANLVINEAYIAESEQKILLLMANSYRIEAQNKLLKILEEPPKNIKFVIVATSKNKLLPTIISRLSLKYKNRDKAEPKFKIDVASLDLKKIYDFLELCSKTELEKSEFEVILNDICISAINFGYKFSEKELMYFLELSQLSNLNTKPYAILSGLLLLILSKRKNL